MSNYIGKQCGRWSAGNIKTRVQYADK